MWIRFMGAPVHQKQAIKADWNKLKNKARHMVGRDKRKAWHQKVTALEKSFKEHDLHQGYRRLRMLGCTPHVAPRAYKSADGAVHHGEQVPRLFRSYFDNLLNCKRTV